MELSYYQRNRERILLRQKEYYKKKKINLLQTRKNKEIDSRQVIIERNVIVRF
jgi:NAD(P)H-nitrite reductase large subunit